MGKAQKQLDGLQRQRNSLFDLLEQGVYTQEIFLERSRILSGRIAEAEQQVQNLQEYLAALEESEKKTQSFDPSAPDAAGSL